MDATLAWTVVGSIAGVAGVATALGIAILQARSGRKHPPLGSGDPIRVVVETPGSDETAGAGLTALRAPTGRLPEHVRGRDELLARLRALAQQPDGRVHVLAGLGGTGKSTVALQVAEEMTRAGRAAWWVPAVDASTLTARLMGLARDLGASRSEVAETLNGQRDPASLLWRFLEPRLGWLLIFDNADDLGALTVGGNDAASGAGWLRPTASGLVVVTSREQDPQAWGRHAELHPAGWLDPVTGGQVLADLAREAGPAEDAATLSERLGGLPLALHHAGSQLASPFAVEKTFAEYVRALDTRFGQLMGRGAVDDRTAVTRTWELSLDSLAARGRPQARLLLRVLSCLAPAVLIPARMLDLGVLGRLCPDEADGAAEGLAALASVGLIATSAGPVGTRPGVTVHPLVSETSRVQLDSEDPAQVDGIVVALIAAAAAELGPDRPEDWPAWDQLVPHLNALNGYLARRLTSDDLAALSGVSAKAAQAFVWAGSYVASQELAESALRYATRLGADHPAVLALRFWLASAHEYRGEYAEAEREYRDALAAEIRVKGPDHVDTLSLRSDIAKMLAEQGKYEQAEKEYRDVLSIMLRVLGADHQNTLATSYNIGRMLAKQGQYEQAEKEYRDVLAARLRVLGPDHPSALTSRYEAARMLVEQGKYEQAEKEYRDVSSAMLRVLGPDHRHALIARYEVAWTLAEQGKYEQAERGYRDVLADEIRVNGSDHPETLTTRHEIARMLAARDRREEAEQEYRDVLAARLRVLGPNHPDTRATEDSLAALESQAQRKFGKPAD